MAQRFSFVRVPVKWLDGSSRLTPSAFAVLCVLLKHADWDTGECWPMIATIARCANMSENTVRKSVRELIAVGAISVKFNKKTSHRYTVLDHAPAPSQGAVFEGSESAPKRVPGAQQLNAEGANGRSLPAQKLKPNVVENVIQERRPPSPLAAARSGDGGLRPFDWRSARKHADSAEFKPGSRTAVPSPLAGSAPEMRAVG